MTDVRPAETLRRMLSGTEDSRCREGCPVPGSQEGLAGRETTEHRADGPRGTRRAGAGEARAGRGHAAAHPLMLCSFLADWLRLEHHSLCPGHPETLKGTFTGRRRPATHRAGRSHNCRPPTPGSSRPQVWGHFLPPRSWGRWARPQPGG